MRTPKKIINDTHGTKGLIPMMLTLDVSEIEKLMKIFAKEYFEHHKKSLSPSAEDVKRWHQLLVGRGSEAMVADIFKTQTKITDCQTVKTSKVWWNSLSNNQKSKILATYDYTPDFLKDEIVVQLWKNAL